MKKYILVISLLFFSISSVYSEDIGVSARVNVINRIPEFVSIIPNFSPVVVAKNNIQGFSLGIKDLEGDNLTYTITADKGAVYPNSGNISDSTLLQSGDSYIDFIYLSSATYSGKSNITVTINDGVNAPTIKNIDIYSY